MTILLAAALATFPGGNFNDLAKSMAETTSLPAVVVLTKPPAPIKAFEYNQADRDQMASAIKTGTGLMLAPGVHMVIHDGLLPIDKVSKVAAPAHAVIPKDFPETAVAAGLVTFATEKNESLKLDSLKGFAKPVNMHWFFTGQTVGLSVKAYPEMDFLALLAKGIGGRFLNSGNTFKIDIDGAEIRNRAVRTIQAEAKKEETDAFATKQRDFRIAALNSLTPAQLSQLFVAPGNTIRTPIRSGGDIERLAVALIRETESQDQQTGQTMIVLQQNRNRNNRNTNNNATNASILSRTDPRRQAMLVTDTFFNSWVEVPVRGGNGQSVETVLRPESRRTVTRRGGGGQAPPP